MPHPKLTQVRAIIARCMIVAYVCLIPIVAQAATMGDLFIISKDPLFAEIPVCNPGPGGVNFTARVVTDEELDSDGKQPFAEKIQAAFDTYSDIEGLISVSAEDAAPDGVSLIVTLVNGSGVNADSSLFSNLTIVRQAPEDFGCVALVEEETVVVEDSGGEFIIDIVTGDTWRNIAELVNIAWYNKSYPVEQVMLALYKYNNQESLNLQPGGRYSLPNELLVPANTYPATINHNQLSKASYLDEIGKLKVVKKRVNNSELKKLREEFALLQEQVNLLRKQLVDSRELMKLKDSEVDSLRKNLINTRQRISVLEKENLELNDRGMMAVMGESISQNPIAWIAAILALFAFAIWASVRSSDARQRRNIAVMRQYGEKKK